MVTTIVSRLVHNANVPRQLGSRFLVYWLVGRHATCKTTARLLTCVPLSGLAGSWHIHDTYILYYGLTSLDTETMEDKAPPAQINVCRFSQRELPVPAGDVPSSNVVPLSMFPGGSSRANTSSSSSSSAAAAAKPAPHAHSFSSSFNGTASEGGLFHSISVW